MNKPGVIKITKQEWRRLGGLRNSALFRKHNGRCWQYYRDLCHGTEG